MNAKPISEGKVGAGCGGVGLTLFGSVFFLAGCFFMWFVVISPILEWNSARLWPSAEATILTSKVVTHHDSEGSSYSAEFTYKYSVNGQPYENDQYGFIDWSGGRKSADKKQKQHPVGSKTDCYYDPQDPANSVLNRELGWELLFGLIPLIFILVGGGIMYAGWSGVVGKVVDKHNRLSNQVGDARVAESAGIRSGLASPGAAANSPLAADELDQKFEGPQKLKPETSRWVVLAVVLFINLFWNGIVSIFVYGFFTEAAGWGKLGMGLFLTPFVLVGLGLIVFFFYTLLGMFNPTVEIAMSSGAVPIGGEVDIAWEVNGNARRIRNLKIHIQGEESATYRRGTDTHTDSETFSKVEVVSATSLDEIQFGSATVQIPDNVIHSFDGGNNEIKWTIEVVGDIPLWPDVSESFVFRVKPA